MALNTSGISIDANGNVAGQAPKASTSAPFVITGLKASQPGGLGSTVANTLPKSQIAAPGQQKATGNAVNTPSNANIASALTSSLSIPAMAKPGGVAAGISIGANGLPVQGSSTASAGPQIQTATPQPYASTTSTTPVNASTGINPNAGQFGTGGIGGTPAQTIPQSSQVPSQTGSQFPQIVSGLASFNPYSNPAVAGAYNSAQNINTQIEQSKTNEANAQAQNFSNPIPIGDQTGRDAVIRNQYLAQQNALASQFQGQSTLFNAGLTGTGQQLTAQNEAAGYSQPQLGSIGQVPFNPTTGSQGSILGSTQPGGLNAAGNLLGQFQGAQTAGAALGGVSASQTQQVEGYKSALQQGKNLQSQLTDLISTFGLNPNDLNAANIGIQKIAQNTSSPQYKILSNYVNDIANTYAQILTPPGGSATDTTRGIATSMLDATASGQSLLSVMQSLDNAAQAKIAGVQTTGGSTTNNNQSTGQGIVQTQAGAVNTNW